MTFSGNAGGGAGTRIDIGELAGERSDDDGDVVGGWTMVAGRSRNVAVVVWTFHFNIPVCSSSGRARGE